MYDIIVICAGVEGFTSAIYGHYYLKWITNHKYLIKFKCDLFQF